MDEVTCLKKRRWRMDKLSLKNKDWKDFYLSDFFDFEKGNQNNMASLTTGTLPLVSAKKTDNGYKGFVSKEQKKIFRGDILTLNNDGDGGAGIAYYQPTSMALDSHVSALIPKSDLNKYHLLFVSMCITKQRERFGHGYSINGNRLRAFKIMLPLAADCTNPDWQFMEEYMRRKETLLLKPAVEKLCKRLNTAWQTSQKGRPHRRYSSIRIIHGTQQWRGWICRQRGQRKKVRGLHNHCQ